MESILLDSLFLFFDFLPLLLTFLLLAFLLVLDSLLLVLDFLPLPLPLAFLLLDSFLLNFIPLDSLFYWYKA